MTLSKKQRLTLVLYILPAFFFFSVFILFPVVQTLQLSFIEWNGINSAKRLFVGFDNYIEMLKDPLFMKALKNNIILIILSICIQIPMGLIIANILSKPLKGLRYFKLAFFMPYVLSATAVSLMWKFILHPNNGLLNIFLETIGLEKLTRAWIADPKTALLAVILVGCWQGLGFVMILLLAAIVSIPKSTIESSKIDGVNGIQYFIYIVIPYLWDVLKVVTILIMINGMKSFDVIYVLTQGGPFHSSEVLTTLMYKEAFISQNIGVGSAVAIAILVICLILTIATNGMASRNKGGAL